MARLQANGGNLFRTAKELNIPRLTMMRWAKGETLSEDVSLLQQESVEELSIILERIARKYAAHAESPQVIAKASSNQAATVIGIAVDKGLLLQGRPTVITTSLDTSKRIKEIISQAATRDNIAPTEAEKALQARFADPKAVDYEQSLDPNKHPELWPSGRCLFKQDDKQDENESVS